MTWVRYDDNVGRHPKVRALDDATYRLWREAIEWCSQNLTDGVVLAHELGLTSTRASPARARKLVASALWHSAGELCESANCPPPGQDGWVIHDYWDYQRKRADLLAEREANRERQRKWMEKARAAKKGAANASANTVTDDTSNASSNGNPAPPRPAPKGRVGTDVPTAPPAAHGGVAAANGGAQTVDERAIAARAAAEAEAHRRAIEAHDDTTNRGLAAARAALRRPADPAA